MEYSKPNIENENDHNCKTAHLKLLIMYIEIIFLLQNMYTYTNTSVVWEHVSIVVLYGSERALKSSFGTIMILWLV